MKWGILGTSYISEVIADAIKKSTIAELVGIGSRSATNATLFAEKFSIPHIYDDYQSLLEDKNIDAIYIGLPNHLHKEWIIRSARAKKHILCEKPFVLSTAEMQEVMTTVNENNVFCMEALMYRHHPFTLKLKEIIDSKTIGDIKLYNATYTANIANIANPTAGGSIRNLGCYPISLVRYLANQEPTEITAMGRLNSYTQNDNQGNAILKFPDNSVAIISAADDIAMRWQFDIYGSKGSLKVISNPWLPEKENNRCLIYLDDHSSPTEINISADKPLYTYQIDAVSNLNQTITLQDSLGNIAVLEKWLSQLKLSNLSTAKLAS